MLDEASLTLVRDRLRGLSAPKECIDRALIVASELGRNHLRHAQRGRIAVRTLERRAHVGIEVVAVDEGPGLDDVDRIFEAAPRESGISLGVGVSAVKRLSTEMDLDVRLGEGTCFRVRIFDSAVPRQREVGIYGRAIAGEARSGDHALFVRDGGDLRVMLCDGLGHGPDARVASDAAVDVFRERLAERPGVLLEECHRRLGQTRGVVMATAHVTEPGGLELSSAGNIETMVSRFRATRRFGGTSATIGGRGGVTKTRTELGALEQDDVMVLMTDGIQTKAAIEDDPILLRAHPAVIAQHVVERFARSNDDALVLVVR